MRRHGPPRLNRLPQRLDYTLIPAPLDLSRPLVDEKAELPAIIVTPSSPSGAYDFHIAFLAPPPKQTLRERVSAAMPNLPSMPKLRLFHRRLPSEIQLPTTPYKHEFEEPPSLTFKTRASTVVLLALLVFVMGCHLVMHSMVSTHPRLDFSTSGEEDTILTSLANGPLDSLSAPQDSADSATPSLGGWFNLNAMWAPMPITDGKRAMRFVITEEPEEMMEQPQK